MRARRNICGIVPRGLRSRLTAIISMLSSSLYILAPPLTQTTMSTWIKYRLPLVNRSYFGLNKQLGSRSLSRAKKLTPLLIYGTEAWTLSSTDASALGVFERKVLRMIFDQVRVGAVSEPTGSCMSTSMTWTLLSVLISSGFAGSAMSFGWMKTLLRDECLMWSAVIGGRDDRVRFEHTRLKWP